jgi:hypothetical protein
MKRAISFRVKRLSALPSSKISPEFSFNKAARQLSKVDLPQPFGPKIESICPFCNEKERFENISRSPEYLNAAFFTSSTFI